MKLIIPSHLIAVLPKGQNVLLSVFKEEGIATGASKKKA